MRQFHSYAMRCTLTASVIVTLACTKESDDDVTASGFTNPTELISALQKRPARTLQQLHTQPDSIEKDALLLSTIEQFPRRSKPLCSILSTNAGTERCLRLTERPHLWKAQPNHFAKSEHKPEKQRDCTLDPHPNTCWTAQALLDSKIDLSLAEDSCKQIESELWQAECFFTLSESMNITENTLSKALETCSYSNQFQKSCWMHMMIELAQRHTDHINDMRWLKGVQKEINTHPKLPKSMKRDLWQHLLAKLVTTAFELGESLRDETPSILIGHWQNQYATEALRWCDQPIQHIDEWIILAQEWNHASTPCNKRTEPRGMEIDSDLWIQQTLPNHCNRISFLGQSHRIYCQKDDALSWHMALLEASARLRPNNTIFVLESIHSEHEVIRQRSENLQNLDWQEKPDQR